MKTLHYPGDTRDTVGQYVGPTTISPMEWLRIDAVDYDPNTDTSTARLTFAAMPDIVTAKWMFEKGEGPHPGIGPHTLVKNNGRRTR